MVDIYLFSISILGRNELNDIHSRQAQDTILASGYAKSHNIKNDLTMLVVLVSGFWSLRNWIETHPDLDLSVSLLESESVTLPIFLQSVS